MTQWTAFVGVTGIVLSLFLALARLSQGVVREDDPEPGDTPDDAGPRDDTDGGDAVRSTHVGRPPDPGSIPDPESQRAADADPATDRTDAPRSTEPTGADAGAHGDDSPPVRTAGGPGSTDGAPGGDHGEIGSDASRAVANPERPDDTSPPIAATTPAGVEYDRSTAPAMDLSPGMLLANVALTQGLFGVAVAGAAVYFAIPSAALGLSGAPLSTGLPAIGVGVGFGVVLWIGNELAAALAESAGVAYDERLRAMLAPDSATGWVLLLGGALPLVAVVEELLFRAAAVGVPAAAYGASPWALAVVSSLAFALGHGAQGRVGMVVTGALGFALAAGFVLTESLVVVVIAHYLVNALEFLVHEGLGVERPFG